MNKLFIVRRLTLESGKYWTDKDTFFFVIVYYFAYHKRYYSVTEQEYNQAIDLWADQLYSFAMYCCKDRERCRDAMQEAFAALWERRKDVEFERCKRFLLTVTQHKIIDGIRRDSKNEPLGEELEERQTTRPHDNLDLTSTIQTAMRQLSEQQRIILTLHDIEGYNYKEIAEMQEMNYSQVQVAAFRARCRLREVLRNEE